MKRRDELIDPIIEYKGAIHGRTDEYSDKDQDYNSAEALPFIDFKDFAANLDSTDFVEGLLTTGGMSVVYGKPSSGKTFFVTDLALHVALGRTWRDREIDQGGVIYCALEGKHGIGNRLAAFRAYYNLDGQDLPFRVVPVAINLLDPAADASRVVATIKAHVEHIGIPCRLVVIDTLARAMAGGNENASEDMGALVASGDLIRQATDAHICFIHHSGKDDAKGARGHSNLLAAIDAEIEVTRPDKNAPSVATVTKERDLPTEGVFAFTLKIVELGMNRRGKPVTSCVVEPADRAPVVLSDVRLGANAQIARDLLIRAMGLYGVPTPEGINYPTVTATAVSDDHWRQAFYDGRPNDDSAEIRRQAFTRVVKELLAKRVIGSFKNLVWLVRDDP